MGDRGSKDKGKREQQKKAQLSPKEKRKLKKEKKNNLLSAHLGLTFSELPGRTNSAAVVLSR
jgi:hypothetical protein